MTSSVARPGKRSLGARLASRYAPADDIPPPALEEGLMWAIRNGVGNQIMETLAIGTFLTAYALALGASNVMIGVLAAAPALAQLAQLPGLYVVERYRMRRFIVFLAGVLSRPMLLLMGFAAFLPGPAALALLLSALTLRYIFGAQIACAWNSWMRDLVPEERMGAFFSTRLRMMTVLGVVFALAGAGFVDLWARYGPGPAHYAYSILLVGAFFAGSFGIYAASRMPEPRMPEIPDDIRLMERILHPFRDDNFRRLMLFLGSWNFAVNLATPFFTVHMLKRLELDLSIIIVLTTISQIANVLVLRQWGAIADRFSNKTVLSVCGPLFIGCIFLWTFTTFPDPHAYTLPLLFLIHVFTGIASAGVTLASGNIALKLAPRGAATGYLSANSLVVAAASGLAPIIGGLFIDFFMAHELSIVVRWRMPGGELDFSTLDISQWDFFFLLATVIGLLSLHRLGFVEESGEVEEGVVLGAFFDRARRAMRNMANLAVLRLIPDFPSDLLRRRSRNGGKGAEPDWPDDTV